MTDEDINYIDLIVKEIVNHIDMFSEIDFETEKMKFIYIGNILGKINVFINLLQITILDDHVLLNIGQIMSFNINRLIEISGYTEEELENGIREIIKK